MQNSIYVFLGRENVIKEEALGELRAKVLSEGPADLNYSIFYPDRIDPVEFRDAVDTQPFLTAQRLVIVKDIERLPEAAADSIINYSKNPSHQTVLVLLSQLEPSEFNGRHAEFFLEVSRRSIVRVFERLKEEKLLRYLLNKAALDKKTISDEAVKLLIERAGDNLAVLKTALEQLISYAGTEREIKKTDVEAIVGRVFDETVFTLTRAIYRKQAQKALTILAVLFKDAVKPEMIIGAIGAELRRIQKVKIFMGQKKNYWHIQKELKVSRGVLNELEGAAKDMEFEEIKRCFSCLLKADYDCKNKSIDKRLILEILVVKLSELGEFA